MKKIANYNISLKVFLQNEKGETLVLETPDNSSYLGKYDLPGGRIDQGEFYVDLFEILDREIKEEVGDVKYSVNKKPTAVGRHRTEYSDRVVDIFYTFYEAKIVSGDIIISDEHCDYKWVKLDEIVLEDYFISGILEGAKMYLGK